VNEPAFDPSSHRFGEASWWSRRGFVKLSFATSGAIIAASFLVSRTKSYRIALLGTDPYAMKVLTSLRQIQNTEIVTLSRSHVRPDLIVVTVLDLSDSTLMNVAAKSESSVLIVTPVCQTIAGLDEIKSNRLQCGRFVGAGAQRRLVPELISLSETIRNGGYQSTRLPIADRVEPALHPQRVFSGWGVWIDPLA